MKKLPSSNPLFPQDNVRVAVGEVLNKAFSRVETKNGGKNKRRSKKKK
ncbi:MAG: hypothetical protein ACOCVY_02190 [Patescibacteria group bacterium]|jgi:hypothetical protein